MGWKEPLVTIQLVEVCGVTDDEVRTLVPSWGPPCYVQAYDPQVGIASLVCTGVAKRALKLTRRAAFELWQSSPDDDPVLPDGRPHQPLRGFTVVFQTYQPDPWLN